MGDTVRTTSHRHHSTIDQSGDISLTRRVFGALSGAAIALTAGGTIAGVASSGSVAGGDAVRTSFGTVQITSAERQSRLQAKSGGSDPAHATHAEASNPRGLQQPANNTWGSHLLVELTVHNDTAAPILLPPGQLRLKVGTDGPTITNRGSSGVPATLGTNETARMLISFLIPSDAFHFSAEFIDPWDHSVPLNLRLPRIDTRPGWLEANHG
jgi:hypothetical protein